ncbi:flavin-containing monooxygenase [Chromohalobacter beijerinckii]|uniref:Flavin-containing monooxygenase n=1 Tax=Chromohalobacter beijerinckii TaxID=86179 RepID=A0ABV8XGJ3_9GAMM|nr:NAD(P)/FAD-dependent oxidoreductase [Chromohalobacter beijerinckii]MCK0766904.1 NAD(P)/FAD-dependent oxidoreductase [Chromohalobacter beijerinckii]
MTELTLDNLHIDTLVVGAGQAGVAMSEHLGKLGVPHLVLERHRIAEAWRTARWDSLVANGPAWHDRFPGLTFDAVDARIGADDFPSKESVAIYFEAYARQIDAPIRTGVDVHRVTRNEGSLGFTVETSQGVIVANRVVAATGPFQHPVIPAIAPRNGSQRQLHSSEYRHPEQLPDGAVLVVGAGSSGVQIADELLRAGKRVYLSVGPHDRPPRTYRGRDFCWWLGVLGKWDAEAMQPGTEHVTIAVSGARGGRTVDFRELAHRGMTLVGRTQTFDDGVATFGPDLADNLARGDENLRALLDDADAYIAHNGLDLPEDPDARRITPDPECVTQPLRELDLEAAGVSAIVWATGFKVDYSWLDVDAFDADGKPHHQRGISTEPGVYFLGLPWLSRRGSSFIWGVWHDAKHIADHIATQRRYLDYHLQAQSTTAPRDTAATPPPTYSASARAE